MAVMQLHAQSSSILNVRSNGAHPNLANALASRNPKPETRNPKGIPILETHIRQGRSGCRVGSLLVQLGWALFALALAPAAFAQSTVTLAWDPSSDPAVVGYRVYEGGSCRAYTNVIDVGSATSVTLSNLIWGATYFFALTAYDASSNESPFSGELSFTVPFPSSTASSFAADSGTFTAPFVDVAGSLTQPVTTGLTTGGRAVYNFSVTNTGGYLVTALVVAPDLGQNSFYINIDSEPTDPLMIWDIPVTPSLSSRTVSWRGNGNGDPALDQFQPKVFQLAAGPHQLIVVGQDANTMLGTISILPAPPVLNIQLPTLGSGQGQGAPAFATLSISGQAYQACTILSSTDLKTWTPIGSVTLDSTGAGQFTDMSNTPKPCCMYRVQAAATPSS